MKKFSSVRFLDMRFLCLKTVKYVGIGAVVAFGLLRCGSDSKESSSAFDPVFTIFSTQNCGAVCHKSGGSADVDSGVKLDLSSKDAAYSGLTTLKVTATESSACASVSLVKAGTPSSSYLMGILFDDLGSANFAGVSGCTPTKSHHSAYPISLSASDRTTINDWIQAGAKK